MSLPTLYWENFKAGEVHEIGRHTFTADEIEKPAGRRPDAGEFSNAVPASDNRIESTRGR